MLSTLNKSIVTTSGTVQLANPPEIVDINSCWATPTNEDGSNKLGELVTISVGACVP